MTETTGQDRFERFWTRRGDVAAQPGRPKFYSVAETARLLGMSQMTLYRAIQDDQFPAVRVRGRLIVPAQIIDAMSNEAMETGRVVDSAEWSRRTT